MMLLLHLVILGDPELKCSELRILVYCVTFNKIQIRRHHQLFSLIVQMLCFRWIPSVGRQWTTQIPTYCILFWPWQGSFIAPPPEAVGQFVFSLWLLIVSLCLVGAADTPGCVSLLPASLFSNSNPGWAWKHLTRLARFTFTLSCTFSWMFWLCHCSDQPGILCSFKIPSAWSCAWCLNPQFDKTFSTGQSLIIICPSNKFTQVIPTINSNLIFLTFRDVTV